MATKPVRRAKRRGRRGSAASGARASLDHAARRAKSCACPSSAAWVIEDDGQSGRSPPRRRASLRPTDVAAGASSTRARIVHGRSRNNFMSSACGRDHRGVQQVSLAGLSRLARPSSSAARAGIADHAEQVGAGAKIAAKSASSGMPRRDTVAGYPAVDLARWLLAMARSTSAGARLPVHAAS
jgi:hypothetical protein